jgi:hypothetical protein
MVRALATPARRLRHCQLIQRGWSVPTLRGFPPPPYMPSPAPFWPREARETHEPPAPYQRRSRSYRKLHDCHYIPDMSAALQFLSARRAVAAPAPVPRDDAPGSLRMAIAIGLLMTVAPPVAITVVWATPAFSRTAQLALTAYGALVTLVLGAVAIAAML